jgi:RNA polymerase sigma factor (sigma-70 family)
MPLGICSFAKDRTKTDGNFFRIISSLAFLGTLRYSIPKIRARYARATASGLYRRRNAMTKTLSPTIDQMPDVMAKSSSRDWPLLLDIHQRMHAARPRLLRLARLNGIDGANAEDAVQESLLHAWLALNDLRSADRFDPWLDAICRNVCFQQQRIGTRNRHWSLPWKDAAAAINDIPDPTTFDPIEELNQQDLGILLDRAMGQLSPDSREALRLCYLQEMPQREAAQRLGMTISALEARLHRARKQLRTLLSGDLRAEAQAFGLLFNDADSSAWHGSRIWCHACGKYYLEGRFYQTPGGHNSLTMRCAGACNGTGTCINVGEVNWLKGVKTFLPALKRLWRYAPAHIRAGLLQQGMLPDCAVCKEPLTFQIQTAAEANVLLSMPAHVLISYTCRRCGISDWSDAFLALLDLPAVRQFCDAHPRTVMLPTDICIYAGQRAIRFAIADVTSEARCIIFTTYERLLVLDITSI